LKDLKEEANMPTNPQDGERRTAVPSRTGAAQPGSITTGELMGGGRELTILHAGDQYHLRITSNGKLILTK
jgi:hemin uptake protein HemP